MNEPISTTMTPVEQTAEPKTERSGIRWGTVLVWVVIVALLGMLGWGLLNSTATQPEAGDAAPNFEMQFFDGYEWNDLSSASLEDMRGNVVVLNFWASWCVECRVEAELLESTWRQYRDQGVIFLGIAYVDSDPKSKAYMQEFDITYPNAPDLGTAISKDYRITGVPETFFIDKDGQVAHTIIGPVSANVLHNQIAQLISE